MGGIKFACNTNNKCSFAERNKNVKTTKLILKYKNTLSSEDHLKTLKQKLVLEIHTAFINMEVLFLIYAILFA
jgi:hypothetical protein